MNEGPTVIMHTSLSLDSVVQGFDFDMKTYYEIAYTYMPDMFLVSPEVARKRIDEFMLELPNENTSDLSRPKINWTDERPHWVIPDCEGILYGMLHIYRQSEYCKDPIILVTESTPKDYIDYLKARSYRYFCSGKEQIDFRNALEVLQRKYECKTVLTDSEGETNSILLAFDLIDKISMIVSPSITGGFQPNLLHNITYNNIAVKLELMKQKSLENGDLLLLFEVVKHHPETAHATSYSNN